MVAKKNFWRGRRVLVTGGSGFVGYALARALLAQGARVCVLDIRPLPPYATRVEKNVIRFVRGSVTSEKVVRALLKRERIETVFHLAAEAIVARAHTAAALALDTNVRGTWTVLEAACDSKSIKEIVVASSDKAYGSHPKLPYREETPLAGKNPYDVSKSAADLIAAMYAKAYRLPVAIARCGNIYGPGDLNWSRIVPDALRSVAHRSKLELRSNGKMIRDYVYIDDIVEAYITLASQLTRKRLGGEAFNFATKRPLSVLEVVKLIDKAVGGGKLTHVIRDTTRHEIHAQYLDSSKASRILGWKPRVARSEGFKRTAAWYADFLEAHS